MTRAHSASLALLTLVYGCGGAYGGGSTGPGGPLDVTGSWNLSAAMTNSSLAASCVSSGTLVIGQSGGAISGTATRIDTCTIGSAHPADTLAGTIDAGQVTGATASFKIASCTYQGAITGAPTNQMGGTTSCILTFSGTPYPLGGTWHASR